MYRFLVSRPLGTTGAELLIGSDSRTNSFPASLHLRILSATWLFLCQYAESESH